jgi:hypothetical protein
MKPPNLTMLYEIIVIMLPVVAPISTCSTINEIGI